MAEWIKGVFVAIFGTNSPLATIIISMIPIIELRGAIPFGADINIWAENVLPVWKSFLFSVFGSSLVCIILTFAFWPLFKWLKSTKWFKKLANAIENKLNKNSKNIQDKANGESDSRKSNFIKLMGVFVFVAIPLPLTGVWTGTCLALFIGLSKKDTIISVLLGNLVAGGIMTLISYFFADNTGIVLLVFLALVVIFLITALIKYIIDKNRNKLVENNEKIEKKDDLI